MLPVIQYNEEFYDKLRNIHKTETSNKIILKCIYPAYHDIILNCTSLPTVLIDLICIWIDDEITLLVNFKSEITTEIALEGTCINFVNTQANFALFNHGYYNMHFCDNILLFSRSLDKYEEYFYAYSIYFYATHEILKDEYTFYRSNYLPISVKIINHNLLLTVCDLIHTIKVFFDQQKVDT